MRRCQINLCFLPLLHILVFSTEVQVANSNQISSPALPSPPTSSSHHYPLESNDLIQYLCNDSLAAVRSAVEKIFQTAAGDRETSIIDPFIKFLNGILADKVYPCNSSIRFANNMMYIIELMGPYLPPKIEIRQRNIEISNNREKMWYFHSIQSSFIRVSDNHFAQLFVYYSEIEEALSHYNVTKIKNAEIISPIIGATAYDNVNPMKETNFYFRFGHSKPLKGNYTTACAHWDFKKMVWNTKRCTKRDNSNSTVTFCNCDMYGNYAVMMMNPQNQIVLGQNNDKNISEIVEDIRDALETTTDPVVHLQTVVAKVNLFFMKSSETKTNSSDQITAGLTNDKNISEIVEDIRDALQTYTDPVSYTQTVLDQVNLVFKNSSQTKKESSQIIISNSMLLIDEFGLLLLENPTINESLSFSTNTTELKVFRNVAVVNQSIDFKSDHSSIRLVDANYSTPGTISAVFVKYVNIGDSLSSAAPSLPRNLKVNSDILGVSLPSNMSIKFSPNQVIITLRHIKPIANNSISFCVFWDYKMVQWDSSGCERSNRSNSTTTICLCDHLTNFAVLISMSEQAPNVVLDWITLIGSSISIVSLIICLVCFSLIGTRNMILINLCGSLLIADVTIFASVIYEMKRSETSTGADVPCQVFAILLHLFYLSAFMWMGIEGFQQFQQLFSVFAKCTSMRGFYIVGYGIPLVIISITALLNHLEAALIYQSSNKSCWISHNNRYRWIFLTFVIVILGFNICVAILKWKTDHSKNKNTSGESVEQINVWSLIVLHPLLGLTWLLGFIQENIVHTYIFAVFTSLQGFFIFGVHCLGNADIRQYISMRLFNRKESSKRDTPSEDYNFINSKSRKCETSFTDSHNSIPEELKLSRSKRHINKT